MMFCDRFLECDAVNLLVVSTQYLRISRYSVRMRKNTDTCHAVTTFHYHVKPLTAIVFIQLIFFNPSMEKLV